MGVRLLVGFDKKRDAFTLKLSDFLFEELPTQVIKLEFTRAGDSHDFGRKLKASQWLMQHGLEAVEIEATFKVATKSLRFSAGKIVKVVNER